MNIASFDEIKESLKNFEGLKNWIQNSSDAKSRKRRGEFDLLSEILEQTYHYFKARIWLNVLLYLKISNDPSRSINSLFTASLNKSNLIANLNL